MLTQTEPVLPGFVAGFRRVDRHSVRFGGSGGRIAWIPGVVSSEVTGVATRTPTGFPRESPVATTARSRWADPLSPSVAQKKEAVMAETWSGEFYCVKCKAKREA